jgi:hypothetical protein
MADFQARGVWMAMIENPDKQFILPDSSVL